MITDSDAWAETDLEDLWVYDKLILSRRLGYICGPADVPVPKPGSYIVRPITNMLGMSHGAYITRLSKDTTHLQPGTFWCEVFAGRHLTYDFVDGQQAVCYEGFLEPESLSKFLLWRKAECVAEVPEFVLELSKKYKHINVECKGSKIIEIHLRPNPDWTQYNATTLVPKWKHTNTPGTGYKYVADADGDRAGFWIK